MQRVLDKLIDHLDEHCRKFISLPPFLLLGSSGYVETNYREPAHLLQPAPNEEIKNGHRSSHPLFARAGR